MSDKMSTTERAENVCKLFIDTSGLAPTSKIRDHLFVIISGALRDHAGELRMELAQLREEFIYATSIINKEKGAVEQRDAVYRLIEKIFLDSGTWLRPSIILEAIELLPSLKNTLK